MTVSFIEPADRPHVLALSTAEVAMLVRYHTLYQASLQMDLPNLVDEHCRGNAAQKEAITKLAATQLTAHEVRRTELAALLTTNPPELS